MIYLQNKYTLSTYIDFKALFFKLFINKQRSLLEET